MKLLYLVHLLRLLTRSDQSKTERKNMTSKKELKGLLGQVKAAATQLKDQITSLDDRIEALYAERSELLNMPLSKADYLAAIRADVRAKSGNFGNWLRQSIKSKVNIDYPCLVSGAPLSIPYLDAGVGIGRDMSENGYYYYFEDAIMAGVERALDGEKWSYTETPARDRTPALEALDAKIEALTADRDALASDLVECGLAG